MLSNTFSSSSISVWFKTSVTADQAIIADRGNNQGYPNYFWYKYYLKIQPNNQLRHGTHNNNCVNGLNSLRSFSDGNWHNAIIVLDHTNLTIKMYVDGVLENTITNINQSCYGNFSQPTSIGCFSGGGYADGGFFNGIIDDIGIWNRVLTQQEITTLYQAQNCNLTSTISGINVLCNGDNSGSASVNSNGGTAPYTYSWSPAGGANSTASNLSAGNYTCTITDANQCTTTQTITITQPTALATTSTQANVLCNGASTGSASVSVTGGTPAYTYAWSPSGGISATASNLSSGNYTCTVRDANQCTTTKAITITQPTALASTSTQTNVLCNGASTGSASVSVTGGSPVYTYSWTPSGGTSATASNLGAGNYTCSVRDANQCTTTKAITITQPTALASTSTQTNVLCNGASTGSASVSVTGGSPVYTYSWTPSGGTSATASNLGAGNYTCSVRDANQCTTTKAITITQPIALSTSSTQTNVTCFGLSNGSANITATGGTPAYNYSWTPSGGITATATNLNAGNYTCTVRDANQCTTTKTVTITQPTALTVNISPLVNTIQSGNNTQFNATSINSSANYQWQSSQANLGWVNIPSNSTYSGVNTNQFTITNAQLNNHLQNFRVIAFIGACADTSNLANLNIADTCINTINDTNFVTITDTNYVNQTIYDTTFVTVTDTNYVTVYDTVTTYISVTDTLFINVNTVGLNNNTIINTIKVFPNPTNSYLNIDYGNYANLNGYSVKIINALSQLIYNQPITQQSETIDLSTFGGNGIYFFYIINAQGNTVEIRKIILQ